MKDKICCAIFGHLPMAFKWGFDEEDSGCVRLKLELLNKITELRSQGMCRFVVPCDPGVGLYAGEIINSMREDDSEMELICVTPYEGNSTKWTPSLRNRYFELLEKSSEMIQISTHKTPECEDKGYRRVLDLSDMLIAVYDPLLVRGDAVDKAMAYAREQKLPTLCLNPDGFVWTMMR